jgi:membrane associated rhomboid family serine protease
MIPLKDENPTRSFPFFTILFIAVNIAIFLYQVTLGPKLPGFIHSLAAVPYEITHFRNLESFPALPPPLTLFTSMFLHGGFLHLGGNMLFFWIFGNNIEDAVGHIRFIFFYLLCGLTAGLIQVLTHPHSQVPMVGASGAVSGIMGAYMILYPRARVLTLVFIIFFIRLIRLPAYFFLFFWFLFQALNAFLAPPAPDQGGVAFFAHIGGFIAGVVLIKFFEKGKRRRAYTRL